MPEMSSYKNGVPCWIDLSTTDPDAAKAFYSELFAWTVGPAGSPETNGYTMFLQDEKAVCAVAKQQEQQAKMGVPPMWNSYVAVDSADETTAKAKEAGGTILMEPFDVMEFGRMSVIQDPTGAVFETWQAGTMPGAMLVNEPVSLTWNELDTRDPKAAGEFYGKVFGWEAESMAESPMPYWGLKNNGDMIGGMLDMNGMPESIPANWLVYFSVADTDATVAKAKELGGNVMREPMDIPAGRFAVLADPQGAVFAVIKNNTNM